MKIGVRPVRKDDFPAWLKLWDGYNAFYGRSGETALPSAVTSMTWSRFFDAYEPMHALVDGNYAFKLPCIVKTVVGGDGLSLSIAAASILAKVARDRLMAEMDDLHPGYGFRAHKGYGAPLHIEALRTLGPCPIHRLTWAPVRLMLEGGDPATLSPSTAEDSEAA